MQDRRFSHQRERIYQAVRSSHAHPTAEAVYSQLKPEMPRLSLGTVYRNLRQMAAELGLCLAASSAERLQSKKRKPRRAISAMIS